LEESFLINKRIVLFDFHFPLQEVIKNCIEKFSSNIVFVSTEKSIKTNLHIDLLDTMSISELIQKEDVLIFPFYLKNDISFNILYKNEVIGLHNLLNVSLEVGASNFVLINDISYFGFSEKRIIYNEDSIIFGDEKTPAYIRAQQLMVEEIYRIHHEGLKCSILTLGNNKSDESILSHFTYEINATGLEAFLNYFFNNHSPDLRFMYFEKKKNSLNIPKLSFWNSLFKKNPKINQVEIDNTRTMQLFSN
jgi:hypothetical protein